jgi:GNAT superfamily N-acetyltransferase
MSVQYLNADFMSFLPDLKKLIQANYEELCVTKEFPLLPDYDAYERIAKTGNITCIVCVDKDEVVGYAIFLIQPHLHYKTCLTAFEDIYYLKPEYRKGRTGIKMFKFAEDVLRSAGVNRIIFHTKIHLDNSKLFEYLGYKHTDKLYSKIL